MTKDPAQHWDGVYEQRRAEDVSWFQPRPETSLRLIASVAEPTSSVVDVGAGASTLTDELLDRGWRDVTVVDVSAEALALVTTRLAERQAAVAAVVTDLLDWSPDRSYDLWHDRAVLHFLTDPEDRSRYARAAAVAVPPGGHLVVGTFAADGPSQCSGLSTARCSAADLQLLFAEHADLVHAEREEHRTPHGVVQPFTWVVLRRR